MGQQRKQSNKPSEQKQTEQFYSKHEDAVRQHSVSCGDDDDEDGGNTSSALVGTWDVVSNIFYSPDEAPEHDNVDGAYWVFTATQLTVHDKTDAMNGKSVSYTYDSSTQKLNVVGMSVYTVLELTNSTLKMQSVNIEGYYNVITLKKR